MGISSFFLQTTHLPMSLVTKSSVSMKQMTYICADAGSIWVWLQSMAFQLGFDNLNIQLARSHLQQCITLLPPDIKKEESREEDKEDDANGDGVGSR